MDEKVLKVYCSQELVLKNYIKISFSTFRLISLLNTQKNKKKLMDDTNYSEAKNFVQGIRHVTPYMQPLILITKSCC